MNPGEIWQRFWQIAGSAGIRIKIMGIVSILVVGLGVFLMWYIPRSETRYLTAQLEERGLTLGRNVAALGQDMILTNHQFGLYMLARNTVHNNRDVMYVFVTDGKGDLLVHTFEEGFPLELLLLAQSTSIETPEVIPLVADGLRARNDA